MKIFIYYQGDNLFLKEIINKILIEYSDEVIEIQIDHKNFDLNLLIEKVKYLLYNNKNSLSIVLIDDYIEFYIKINKYERIRCSPCLTIKEAKLTRDHNNSNILAVSNSIIEKDILIDIIKTYLDTPFSKIERHQNRIDLIEN